jgi:hypothetical protein
VALGGKALAAPLTSGVEAIEKVPKQIHGRNTKKMTP